MDSSIEIAELIDLDSKEWRGFTIIPSVRAFEIYAGHDYVPETIIKNCTYAIGFQEIPNDTDSQPPTKIKKEFKALLFSLRAAAICKKLEGREVGCGDLIIQTRSKIRFSQEGDKLQLSWRGNITRIPEGSIKQEVVV